MYQRYREKTVPPRNADGIILELKVNHTPEEVISQINDKQYVLRFMGKLGEEPKYTGRVLGLVLVTIGRKSIIDVR